MTNCKYYDIGDIQKIKSKPNSLSLFIPSNCMFPQQKFWWPRISTNQTFDVTALSESRIKSNMDITNNINLPNYSIEYTPTESHTGGTLLYISNNIAYKPRKGLNIYKTHELDSTFIEIINLQKIKYNSWCSIMTSNNGS